MQKFGELFFPTFSRILTVLLCTFAFGSAAYAQDTTTVNVGVEAVKIPDLLDARVINNAERARLILDLSGETEFAIVSLDAPDRIAVDVRVANTKSDGLVQSAGEGILSEFQVLMADEGRGRTMLFLSEPAQVQQAYLLEAFDNQPARLIVDLIPDNKERFALRVAEDLAASRVNDDSQQVEESTAPGASNVEIHARPLIVIDPGHGGADGGANSPNGTKEKDIVLAFAKELQRLLVSADRFDVALTRDGDTFLKLDERVDIARRNSADLFVSIHADSFDDPTIRGASIYTRDERATDVLDKVLADNENKADIVHGFALPNSSSQVVDVLVDLMRREMRRQSYIAAREMVAHLDPSIKLRRFPIRQADFFVLQAPDVPSILVELGFLSNGDDVANLSNGKWRDRTAEALARGVAAYFDGIYKK